MSTLLPQRLPVPGMRLALELQIPSDVRYIERIVGIVMRQCEELAFPPHKCSLNIPVALSEALSNAILRGNGEDPQKQVRVRSAVDGDSLVIEIADEGAGFDMRRAMRDPTALENLGREDGRGLFLMHRLMDRVEHYTDPQNVVRLTLRR
jgi:serine/threonine-protein kinase RsbW